MRVCLSLDDTAGRASVWFSRAHPTIKAQALGPPKRKGLLEKHQRAGPSPAYSSCMAATYYQPSKCTPHSAEGASWGLILIYAAHFLVVYTHSAVNKYLATYRLLLFLIFFVWLKCLRLLRCFFFCMKGMFKLFRLDFCCRLWLHPLQNLPFIHFVLIQTI